MPVSGRNGTGQSSRLCEDVEMVDRQFLAARAVAETRRRLAPPALARIPDTRSHGRRPRLGLSHPRIDGNYRSTI
jgi:hypothetical protein